MSCSYEKWCTAAFIDEVSERERHRNKKYIEKLHRTKSIEKNPMSLREAIWVLLEIIYISTIK